MKTLQQGFTLIELMIVVAIIGILAAIAIPAYQDFIGRSQTSEGLSLGGGLKVAVADVFNQTASMPMIDSGTLRIPSATSVVGKYVSQALVTNGRIAVTFKAATSGVNAGIAAKSIALIPTVNAGSISWACAAGTGSTIAAGLLPAACR